MTCTCDPRQFRPSRPAPATSRGEEISVWFANRASISQNRTLQLTFEFNIISCQQNFERDLEEALKKIFLFFHMWNTPRESVCRGFSTYDNHGRETRVSGWCHLTSKLLFWRERKVKDQQIIHGQLHFKMDFEFRTACECEDVISSYWVHALEIHLAQCTRFLLKCWQLAKRLATLNFHPLVFSENVSMFPNSHKVTYCYILSSYSKLKEPWQWGCKTKHHIPKDIVLHYQENFWTNKIKKITVPFVFILFNRFLLIFTSFKRGISYREAWSYYGYPWSFHVKHTSNMRETENLVP